MRQFPSVTDEIQDALSRIAILDEEAARQPEGVFEITVRVQQGVDMKKISEVLQDIDQDLRLLETTKLTITATDPATGFETAAVEYLKSILENQKVLATYLANHQLLHRRAGHINDNR